MRTVNGERTNINDYRYAALLTTRNLKMVEIKRSDRDIASFIGETRYEAISSLVDGIKGKELSFKDNLNIRINVPINLALDTMYDAFKTKEKDNG